MHGELQRLSPLNMHRVSRSSTLISWQRQPRGDVGEIPRSSACTAEVGEIQGWNGANGQVHGYGRHEGVFGRRGAADIIGNGDPSSGQSNGAGRFDHTYLRCANSSWFLLRHRR